MGPKHSVNPGKPKPGRTRSMSRGRVIKRLTRLRAMLAAHGSVLVERALPPAQPALFPDISNIPVAPSLPVFAPMLRSVGYMDRKNPADPLAPVAASLCVSLSFSATIMCCLSVFVRPWPAERLGYGNTSQQLPSFQAYLPTRAEYPT